MESLFEHLDLDQDGRLTRTELHAAAKKLQWHWREAPIFALLDLFTVRKPLSRDRFLACMEAVAGDPMGPYGKVLLDGPHFSSRTIAGRNAPVRRPAWETPTLSIEPAPVSPVPVFPESMPAVLARTAGEAVSQAHRRQLDMLDTIRLSPADAALLILDPQRSFTAGAWMRSIGRNAENDVAPIRAAFRNCAALLKSLYGRMEIMLTRCPFPPESYVWDDSIREILDERQLYFIKPGNSALFPPFNGVAEWVEQCMEKGIRVLLIAGCTLNSCVRVSAMEVQAHFRQPGLQTVVDLNLCGARARNFMPSARFGGMSAVASAVLQMTAAGVHVVRGVDWE